MENTTINNLYDRISKILKNDQKYTYTEMSARITASTSTLNDVESYYTTYPPLLDVIELGAALEYNGANYQEQMIEQMKYKMFELKKLLPDVR